MTIPIPFHDFGGRGPLLHFAHPNAYTPACFRQMIEPLLLHYRVIGVCHRPLWPNSRPEEVDDWQVITDDMIRFFDQEGLRQVIGVGHSLGAVTTMFAALKQPDLFRSLILIEPVFLPPAILDMAAANPAGMKNTSLVQGALKRRHRWPSRSAAFDRFRAKAVFKNWSDEALWDYVNFALHEDKATGEVVLTYPREWEARFYALPPVSVWQAIPQVPHPTLAIRGAESDTLRPEAWQLWQELQPQATFVEVAAASHMAPMERPLAVAQAMLHFLRTHDQLFNGRNQTGRVVANYTAAYPDPIAVKAGDEVIVGQSDNEYPGWVWCTGPDGKRGWMPEKYLKRQEDGAVALIDYTARELSAVAGEKVIVGQEANGWVWCANQEGQSGWLPAAVLQMDSS